MHLAINSIHFAYSYASSYASSSPSFCPCSYASSYAATLIHSRIRILIKQYQALIPSVDLHHAGNRNPLPKVSTQFNIFLEPALVSALVNFERVAFHNLLHPFLGAACLKAHETYPGSLASKSATVCALCFPKHPICIPSILLVSAKKKRNTTTDNTNTHINNKHNHMHDRQQSTTVTTTTVTRPPFFLFFDFCV